jgi:hypothetical protein
MGYSVQQRAECVGTFRWVEIQLMEMLANWVPTTPEMEVKILFGRHVWDCAQHADALGKRAFELRAPLHFTLPAVDSYRAFLRDMAEVSSTIDRLSAFYDTLCPGMIERYRDYLENTDLLMDEPTVRILEAILRDYERMAAARLRLAGQTVGLARAAGLSEWMARQQALSNIVAHGEQGERARGEQA